MSISGTRSTTFFLHVHIEAFLESAGLALISTSHIHDTISVLLAHVIQIPEIAGPMLERTQQDSFQHGGFKSQRVNSSPPPWKLPPSFASNHDQTKKHPLGFAFLCTPPHPSFNQFITHRSRVTTIGIDSHKSQVPTTREKRGEKPNSTNHHIRWLFWMPNEGTLKPLRGCNDYYHHYHYEFYELANVQYYKSGRKSGRIQQFPSFRFRIPFEGEKKRVMLIRRVRRCQWIEWRWVPFWREEDSVQRSPLSLRTVHLSQYGCVNNVRLERSHDHTLVR